MFSSLIYLHIWIGKMNSNKISMVKLLYLNSWWRPEFKIIIIDVIFCLLNSIKTSEPTLKLVFSFFLMIIKINIYSYKTSSSTYSFTPNINPFFNADTLLKYVLSSSMSSYELFLSSSMSSCELLLSSSMSVLCHLINS